jgi:diaminopimelate epimerase
MSLRFTKMHGAGNDFVVIDATREPVDLPPDRAQRIADRHFGIGADQILVVEPGPSSEVDFRYRIFNSSGEEVEHCGNGARCFARFVRAKGLIDSDVIRVQTMNRVLELRIQPDGRVTVDMRAPVFDHAQIPFDASGLQPQAPEGGLAGPEVDFPMWPVPVAMGPWETVEMPVPVAVVSMGNPHAVLRVGGVDYAPVEELGPVLESHARFARRVNVGFMQIISRTHIGLRVYERGAGETLACGTGACAAVVAGIRLGWLDERVDVDTRGGKLTIEWAGARDRSASVWMTGPAEFVFDGETEL